MTQPPAEPQFGPRVTDPSATTTTLPAIDIEPTADPTPEPIVDSPTGAPDVTASVMDAPPPVAPEVPAPAMPAYTPPAPADGPSTDEIRAALSPQPVAPVAPPTGYPANPAPMMPPVATAVPPMPAPGLATPTPPPAAATKPPRSAAKRRTDRRGAERTPRRAHLQLKHIDVWSVLKFSCVLAFALFFVWLIMIAVLYGILDVSGVFNKVNDTAHTLNDNNKDVVTPGLVLGGALVIGVINVVLFIVLSTIGSIVYNLCSDLVGGIEVTLSERD